MRTLHHSPTVHVGTKLESDGTFLVRTEVDDSHIVDKTTEVRNSELILPGKREAPVHPQGAKIIWWFQAHPVLWARHKKRYPGIHKDLHSHNQVDRERAAAAIARQHPEWVCTAPKEVKPCPANRPDSGV